MCWNALVINTPILLPLSFVVWSQARRYPDIKVKVKLSSCIIKPYAKITCERVRQFLTSTLCSERWSASRLGRCIPEEKAPVILLSRKLCGYQSWTGRFGEDKISWSPVGYRTVPWLQCHRACCLVAITTELALLQVDTWRCSLHFLSPNHNKFNEQLAYWSSLSMLRENRYRY